MPGTLAAALCTFGAKHVVPQTDEAEEADEAVRARRILYVSHVATPSGGELSLIDLLEVLDRRRFSPRVVIPQGGELAEDLERIGVASDRCPPLQRLVRTRAPLPALRQLTSLLAGARRLRQLMAQAQPDLIHANSTIGALYALLATGGSGVPVIWHSRDMTHKGIVERWVARRAAGIIATSEACRTRLSRFADPGKIELIANGIRLGEPRTPSMLREQLGLSDPQGPLLVAIGQFVPWKGLDITIDAVRIVREEYPQVQLLLIGEDRFGDNPGIAARLRRRIADSGLTDNVHLLGQRRDVREILACADLLVHAAYPEPFGRVIVEALAEGCPAVAFDGDHGPAEILRHDVDGLLVSPRTADALAASLVSLLRSPERRNAMSSAGRQRARERYDRSFMARRTEAFYEALLDCPTRTAESVE